MALNNLESPPPVDKPILLGNANYVTPNKCEGETKANCEMINQTTPSIDFSVLTAADFGITPDSFTNHSGKRWRGGVKSILKKLRRQSTIGIRGSPENNALIRYIAHRKRIKTDDPPSQATPFQRNVLLKDKIAAFQSSFEPLKEAAEEIIHIPYTSKKADTRSHEQLQVGPSEFKAVGLEETLNCKSTNGEKNSTNIQKIPVLHPNTIESRCLPLEATPAAGISKTACGIQFQNTNEILKNNATSQQSCKKVRFAQKQSLEIFDETKPPVTPLQKGCFPSTYHDSSCLRSVLKKTPVKKAEGGKGSFIHSSENSVHEIVKGFDSRTLTCKYVTERSSRPIDKMEAHSKELAVEVFDALQPVATPVCSEEATFGPPGTRIDSSFVIIPIKNTLVQPNFDSDDDLQETLDVISTDESVVSSRDLEDKVAITTSTTSEINPSMPSSEYLQVSRRKAFGKRRRKKKAQKVFHGHYETVSKKPLLSPIPEMTEEISLPPSYQSTPESSVSILDRSCCSSIHETPEKTNSTLHSREEDGNCLQSNLSAVTEDAVLDTVSCSSLQLQDAVLNDTQITFPSEPPGNDSFKTLNNTVNVQVLKSNYSSESEKELGLLNLQGTGEKTSQEASLLIADSAVEQLSGGDICMNFKRFPRRSRRITHYLPSIEDLQSETPRNNPCVPRGSMEELPCTPPTVNNSGFLNEVMCAIEESFRSVTSSTQKRVRRSMRLLKDTGSEGLTWISVPTNDSVNQALVGSTRRARRQSYNLCHPESEILHQKQENLVQSLLPVTEQKSTHTGVEHCRPRKKRKSICF
uniref:cell division cycle-associated protein 2 n=1 Tax=Euleptes europaea TaxID=460621 RepID=UPI0025416430|nr:cell division cycle-associated protein 2 [Euleptes europaea]